MTVLTMIYTLLIRPLELFFELIFVVAERYTNHPGLSIIVLSLVMNFLVLPLYKRADVMQAEERDIEQKLQKGVAHIKKSFFGDERMMILQTYYRQNHYKPTDAVKGSVSLLLQIPFFTAAYHFLSNLEELQGISFGLIQNLAEPDGLLVLGGVTLNLLPILMTSVNLVSCIIYTRGFPLKTKIQLYAMAGFFLIFLYRSPSGLVFYWTLNNLFSLCKTIFFKLKNPKRILNYIFLFAGTAMIVFGGWLYEGTGGQKALLVAIGVLMLCPYIWSVLQEKQVFSGMKQVTWLKGSRHLLILSEVALAILIGGLIPSAVVNSSTLEFADAIEYQNPIWYVVFSMLVAVGVFLIWFNVFYWIAGKKAKHILKVLLPIGFVIAVIDYLFFGTKLGILSTSLRFEDGLQFQNIEIVLNLVVIGIVIAGMIFLLYRFQNILSLVGIAAVSVICIMTGINLYQSNIRMRNLNDSVEVAGVDVAEANFTFSKEGNNVVVIMLDRAIGPYIPYIFNEKPELKESFDGFTYYSNVVSFGQRTNFASAALFGGYEYTPYELNQRDTELLVDKQNEALKVMPVLFDQNGYDVTVCDPAYAGYSWIPDLSIYDDYPNIDAYITEGHFNEDKDTDTVIRDTRRNFFCYSLMKTMPVIVQPLLYHDGDYNQAEQSESEVTNQTRYGASVATGMKSTFTDSYNVLTHLEDMTVVSDGDTDTFLMMVNDTTHNPVLLQEPEYIPSLNVDNTDYDEENISRFTVNGRTMLMEDWKQYAHYEINMAALMALAEWFDYLKENDLYDNTRIILVSDHGYSLEQFDELLSQDDTNQDYEYYAPLLMVKDFNSTGFTESDEFMTNADVPTLAVDSLIEDATNPFTGKAICNDEKYAHDQYVILSDQFKVEINNGYTFMESDWCTVHDNIWDRNNWTYIPLEDAGDLNND